MCIQVDLFSLYFSSKKYNIIENFANIDQIKLIIIKLNNFSELNLDFYLWTVSILIHNYVFDKKIMFNLNVKCSVS